MRNARELAVAAVGGADAAARRGREAPGRALERDARELLDHSTSSYAADAATDAELRTIFQ